jgi:valyl-tRNA synthetase
MRTAGQLTLITEPLDRAMLGRLAGVIERCTEAFESYDHAVALELTERFFWFFCDDYLELVKPRAYGGQGPAAAASAVAALRLALSVQQRLFAPFLPFVTEEVWSWLRDGEPGPPDEGSWQRGDSVHRASWPEPGQLRVLAGSADDAPLDAASAAIGAVRKAKSEARLPMRADVRELAVTAPEPDLAALALVLADVQAAGSVAQAQLRRGDGAEAGYQVTI